MKIELAGRRSLVTGATRGVGLAIARSLAAAGSDVAVCARSESELDRVAADLHEDFGVETLAIVCDVTDAGDVGRLGDRVDSEWGVTDVVVNNAGKTLGGTIETLDAEDILEHSKLDQLAHFRLIQRLAPAMRRQQWGRIININAVIGHEPAAFSLASQMNRAACIALSRSLGMAFAMDNVLVNSINLGWIETAQWTDMHRQFAPSVTYDDFKTASCRVVPMGRFGTPEEVAGLVTFLASDFAGYITAQSIDVSGGMAGQIANYPDLLAAGLR